MVNLINDSVELKASVIIPTKNPGAIFKRVLKSVLGQKTPWSFEVIVVDSGSVDGTLEHVKQFECVKLLEIEPESFGHGRTRNYAISISCGEFVAMITHDALPATPDWLFSLVSLAESDPNIAGVFGRHVAYPNASIFTKQELELHFSGFEKSAIVRLEDRARYSLDEGYRQFLHFFSDNNALIRRKVWMSIPYPDVEFAEDQAWAKAIIEAGYVKAYSHNAIVFHSHDYGLFERLQRSFDESFAFNRLFGYRLCSGAIQLFKSWIWLSSRDLEYAYRSGLWKENLAQVLRSPLDNLMRVVGHYLGAKGNRIPSMLRTKISRDKRMMQGLLKSSLEEVTSNERL